MAEINPCSGLLVSAITTHLAHIRTRIPTVTHARMTTAKRLGALPPARSAHAFHAALLVAFEVWTALTTQEFTGNAEPSTEFSATLMSALHRTLGLTRGTRNPARG